jgi:hypothetical protein
MLAVQVGVDLSTELWLCFVWYEFFYRIRDQRF